MEDESLPAGVLEDVATVVGEEVRVIGRLPGGVNSGAVHVQWGVQTSAVVKVDLLTHTHGLDDTLRARRIVEHMRQHAYPTPAWRAVGTTDTHVWQLVDLVDADPAPRLTPSLVDQLMEIVELQDGQATEPHDHSSYAWRVATGIEPVGAEISGYSAEVSEVVEQLRLMCGHARPPVRGPDMVHADLNPSNVLVRDGEVVALVDLGNAGSGTRATDLMTVLWHTFEEPLDAARGRLWTRIRALVGWDGTAVVATTHILLQLQHTLRRASPDLAPDLVERSRRAIDELNALR